MWSEIQKNGTVKYCERYTDPLTEKVKKVTVTMQKASPQNKNKATRILNAKIDAALDSVYADKKTTLRELHDVYSAAQCVTYKLSTTKRNNIIINSVLDILDEDAIVNNLSAQYVNSRFLDSGKNISTLNTYITRFKAMLNWGYKNDYHDNYRLISKLELFTDQTQEENTQSKYLEPAEITKLLEYMQDQNMWHWYYVTEFLVLTGLRFGELAALKDTDVSLQDLTIHIDKTYDSNNDVVTTPKTDNSIRDIHIQPELITVIKKIRLWRKEKMLERNLSTTLFIPDISTGSYISYAAYDNYLKRKSKLVLNHQISPHKLRHTHASLLAANGMTPEQIARRLGHGRSDVTQDIYIHVTQQVVANDNKTIDSINLIS
ncbi:site-specific integrase [Coprococcus eutactus]|uniref:site-specific integrase n=1 Tax=Coprococcus eutactus TaxID=33043 RepID=UPI00156D7A29|nr:site-specific integrase [Coprococcus eutactus]MCB5504703.1 site-specific integrase [Coprococcus eutactus]NSC96508.1 site-specific integrase [Coprococcus eutactus]NSD35640.1 site-specific integrase [Coprococcus eutactus]